MRVRFELWRVLASRSLRTQSRRPAAASGWQIRVATRSSPSIPATGRPPQRIEVGDAPTAIAVGADAVWVANRADGTLSRIDPRRNAVDKTIQVGAEPLDLVAGVGAVWVVRT
jgi:YVTN family beta-propeller protein